MKKVLNIWQRPVKSKKHHMIVMEFLTMFSFGSHYIVATLSGATLQFWTSLVTLPN